MKLSSSAARTGSPWLVLFPLSKHWKRLLLWGRKVPQQEVVVLECLDPAAERGKAKAKARKATGLKEATETTDQHRLCQAAKIFVPCGIQASVKRITQSARGSTGTSATTVSQTTLSAANATDVAMNID